MAKFGVSPQHIPDYLALVGDAADGYPGIKGLGPKTAAGLISRFGPIEKFPADVLNDSNRKLALLFKELATLRVDAPVYGKLSELQWSGVTEKLGPLAEKMGDVNLPKRAARVTNRIVTA